VLQVFRVQPLAPGKERGGNDHCVINAEPVAGRKRKPAFVSRSR
jgi:hypothetical protein